MLRERELQALGIHVEAPAYEPGQRRAREDLHDLADHDSREHEDGRGRERLRLFVAQELELRNPDALEAGRRPGEDDRAGARPLVGRPDRGEGDTGGETRLVRPARGFGVLARAVVRLEEEVGTPDELDELVGPADSAVVADDLGAGVLPVRVPPDGLELRTADVLFVERAVRREVVELAGVGRSSATLSGPCPMKMASSPSRR